MEKEKLTWRSFADDGSLVGTWNLPGTPTFYVIDHQGVIRHKWVGSPSDYKLGGAPRREGHRLSPREAHQGGGGGPEESAEVTLLKTLPRPPPRLSRA